MPCGNSGDEGDRSDDKGGLEGVRVAGGEWPMAIENCKMQNGRRRGVSRAQGLHSAILNFQLALANGYFLHSHSPRFDPDARRLCRADLFADAAADAAVTYFDAAVVVDGQGIGAHRALRDAKLAVFTGE